MLPTYKKHPAGADFGSLPGEEGGATGAAARSVTSQSQEIVVVVGVILHAFLGK